MKTVTTFLFVFIPSVSWASDSSADYLGSQTLVTATTLLFSLLVGWAVLKFLSSTKSKISEEESIDMTQYPTLSEQRFEMPENEHSLPEMQSLNFMNLGSYNTVQSICLFDAGSGIRFLKPCNFLST